MQNGKNMIRDIQWLLPRYFGRNYVEILQEEATDLMKFFSRKLSLSSSLQKRTDIIEIKPQDIK